MQPKLYPSPSTGGIFPNSLGIVCSVSLVCLFFKFVTGIWDNHIKFAVNEPNITEIYWEIAPPLLPIADKQYVEANPNIPINKPDETNFFSFRDQQAANLLVHNEFQNSSIPFSRGDSENLKLIKNQDPRLREKHTPSNRKINEVQTKNSSKTKNDSNFPSNQLSPSKPEIKKKNLPESFYSVKEKTENQEKIIKLGAKGQKNPVGTKNNQQNFNLDQKQIKNRPRISAHLLNGPILKSKSKNLSVGEVAIDCKLHPYGVYVQQMLQAIEAQWQQLVTGSIPYIKRDRLPSNITFSFELTLNGKVKNLKKLGSSDDSLATDLCRQSISSRAPFGKWTGEMIKELGKSDIITIKFSYH